MSRFSRLLSEGTDLTRDDIISAIDDSDDFAEWCLLYLHNNQEPDELSQGESLYRNNRGFSGFFARPLTEISLTLMRNGTLKPDDLEWLRMRDGRGVPRLGQHWKQIIAALKQGVNERVEVCQ
jgi:hypothetical protein